MKQGDKIKWGGEELYITSIEKNRVRLCGRKLSKKEYQEINDKIGKEFVFVPGILLSKKESQKIFDNELKKEVKE